MDQPTLWQAILFTANRLWPAAVLAFMLALGLYLGVVYGDEYGGWVGRWETVVATAYTPSDPLDEAYHATKGERWRWICADGRTDVRRKPYGVAVPLRHGEPWWAFGTRLIIPTESEYLGRLRPSEREFTVDDVGNGVEYFPTDHGRLHVDLRFVDRRDALRWAGPEGKRTIQVFVCSKRAPVHETILLVHETIAAVHETSVPVHETTEPWPEAPSMPETAEVMEASLPMTDLMLLLVPLVCLWNRYRRRESWEPGR